ncbi:MAG: cupin domain-containing protein [Alphaproteobacteria bacterium]
MIRRAIAVAAICAAAGAYAQTAETKAPPPQKVLETSADTVGSPIRYPPGQAVVSSYVLTMVPGQSTGWHRHDVPLYARMLAGAIRVAYGDGVQRTYRAGDTFMEAMNRWHDGHVVGGDDAKILIVFMGAKGVPNTEMKP